MDIKVEIPKHCYISADPKRKFPFEFFFKITYGIVADKTILTDENEEAAAYPQITVSGFDKLLSKDKIQSFVDNLKIEGSDDWIIKASNDGNIIFKYTGEGLAQDFSLLAYDSKFVCKAQSSSSVVLNVKVKNFKNVQDISYNISTRVYYAPWAKSLTAEPEIVELNGKSDISFECYGDYVEKILLQNNEKVNAPNSPYTATVNKPSLFELQAFNNQDNISDILQIWVYVKPPQIASFTAEKYVFSEGEAVKLMWETSSAKRVLLEHPDSGSEEVSGNELAVYPKASGDDRTAEYKLIAEGYKGKETFSVSAKISLYQTLWKNEGKVSGFFADDKAFSDINYNCRIFTYGDMYYCYAHPKLYSSSDGLKWTEFSVNSTAPSGFVCLAADFYDGVLYIMGNTNGEKRLYFSTYDFKEKRWSYKSAGQSCNSDKGAFALSSQKLQYAQISEKGIVLTRYNGENWSGGTEIITPPDGTSIISGDVCSFSGIDYTLLLLNNGKICVCDITGEEVKTLFSVALENPPKFVCFLKSENLLYIKADEELIEVRDRSVADRFFPPPEDKRPWLGTDLNGRLFGIFPDKNKWIYNSKTTENH